MTNDVFDYHVKDSRKLGELIKSPMVDVVITSPPYWNLKDYGTKNQIGYGQAYDKYLEELTEILAKTGETLKETGSMWIIVDSFKQNGNIRMLPFEIAHRLQTKGFFLQDIIIWQKDKTLPWSSKGKLRNIFEYVLFFTKSKTNFKYHVDRLRESELKQWWVKYPERYSPKGKVPSRVWYIPIPLQGCWSNGWVKHFCPFPPLLVERILLLASDEGDIILDPFAGSGSVLAQSTIMNRKSIGFDLNSEYKRMYYDTVLPFFTDLWQKSRKEREESCSKKVYLERTINSLRRLKYPIVLFKELKKLKSKKIEFILHESDGEKQKYFLVYQNHLNNDSDLLNSVLKGSKLKKFGISTEVHITTLDGIRKKIRSDKFFVYKDGIFNYPQAEEDLNEFLSNNKPKNSACVPPIISKIHVNQRDYILHIDVPKNKLPPEKIDFSGQKCPVISP